MSGRPFASERLCCRCEHMERDHVAARLGCPVVVFPFDGDPYRCPCPEFQPFAEEAQP